MTSGYPVPKDYNWQPKTYTTSASAYNSPAKTLESFFNDMFFLGFNDQLSRWNSLTKMSKPSSFPPYNLVKVDEDTYKVELAVAGYTKEDIDITVDRDQLVVASKETEEPTYSDFIYQGIAQRHWRQQFILGEYMEVTGATLKDGLLIITIEREIPEELKPKTIKIK